MSFALRLILILAVLLAVEFYFIKKITGSLRYLKPGLSKKKIKIPLAIGITVFNLYPFIAIGLWIYSRITGNINFASPENWMLDYLIIFPFWIVVLIIFQCLFYLLSFDVIKLLLYPIYKKHKIKIRNIETRLILAVIIFFSIYVPIRVIYDFNMISIRPVEYYKENLPEEMEGFKITFISDVQADRFTNGSRLNNFIDAANATKPDLILMAGDVITGTPKYINTAAEALGRLKADYGVYSCVGDHDNWAYRSDMPRSLREIKSALKEQNLQMLDNENLILNIGDSSHIGITFITYTYSRQIENAELDNITANTLTGGDLKIFLTHQPRPHLIKKAVEENYDLILTGHTHGGQLTFLFPFYNPSITNLETNYIKGDFWFGNTLMIVTRGLGMSLAPVRYNSTPEVTVLSLTGKKGKN